MTLTLVTTTAQGLKWFLIITDGDEDENGNKLPSTFELKTTYYVEAVILIGIPIAIAALFLLILIIVLCLFVYEFRQNRLRRERFEDLDGAYAEEIAETYMRLLEPVTYDKNTFKYMDCSICLREFDDGEQLQRIPNCSHIFHDQCLRNWFVQAQICPMCRGNIIRVPEAVSPLQESVNS
jgi:hypothetical protein